MRALGCILVAGCAAMPREQAEDPRRSLLAAHAQERAAHLARDADRIAALSSDPFLLVIEGEIQEIPRAEQRAHFARYFARVTFDRWDDLEPPRVFVSADGSWGSVAVRKEVVTRAVSDGGLERTVFAWLETWEHRPGGWELRTLASTRAPER
jgi:hypothetical protein